MQRSTRIPVIVFGLSLKLWLILLLMMGIRFALMFGTGPIHDEAYYWSWSQRLDFGYYDQPFLTGWLLAPFVAVLGDHAWVMRAVATGLTFATSVFLAHAARCLVIDHPLTRPITSSSSSSGQSALTSWRRVENGFLVLAVTSPVLWSVGLLYVHDTVMLCFLSLGLWWGLEAVRGTRGVGARGWWIGTGLALGLAFSAKVSAALWIAALGLGLAMHPAGWSHLRSAGPWIAAAIVLGFVAVFLSWNALNDWVTFRHVGSEHLSLNSTDGTTQEPLLAKASRMALMVLAAVLLSSLTAVALSLGRLGALRRSPGLLALALFVALPFVGFLALSWFREIYINWLIPSALGLLVLGCLLWPAEGRRRWALVGTVPSLLLTCALLVPIALREPRFMPANARDMLGWEGSLEKLTAYRDLAYPDHRIVGNYYQLAAQLAFHQNEVLPSVGLDPRLHQFALYGQQEAGANQSMLVLAPSLEAGRAALEPIYCTVTPISPWPVNHREGRIAEPYLFAISDPAQRPNCTAHTRSD